MHFTRSNKYSTTKSTKKRIKLWRGQLWHLEHGYVLKSQDQNSVTQTDENCILTPVFAKHWEKLEWIACQTGRIDCNKMSLILWKLQKSDRKLSIQAELKKGGSLNYTLILKSAQIISPRPRYILGWPPKNAGLTAEQYHQKILWTETSVSLIWEKEEKIIDGDLHGIGRNEISSSVTSHRFGIGYSIIEVRSTSQIHKSTLLNSN